MQTNTNQVVQTDQELFSLPKAGAYLDRSILLCSPTTATFFSLWSTQTSTIEQDFAASALHFGPAKSLLWRGAVLCFRGYLAAL